jgi:hypothetical protein
MSKPSGSLPDVPYAYTVFCDDLRTETSGKSLYIGVYGTELIIAGAAPQTLTQLWLIMHYVEPKNFTEEPLRLEVYGPDSDEPLVDIEAYGAGPRPDLPNSDPDKRHIKISTSGALADLTIANEGDIRVVWRLGDRLISGGRVAVRFIEEDT